MIKSSKSYTRIAITVPKEQAAWFKKHNFRVLGQSVLKDENGHAKVDMVNSTGLFYGSQSGADSGFCSGY